MEHLQFSTAFSDNYQVFALKGTHNLELNYNSFAEATNIIKSGLGLFTYCSSTFEMLTSTFMSSLLWVGGNGSSDYLPVIGAMPTTY